MQPPLSPTQAWEPLPKSQWNEETARHLLRRAGWSAHPEAVARAVSEGLAGTLKKTGLACRIYGMKRNITADVVDENLTYRPFSEDGFIADLASARGVIAGGGFTLMGEAVYLHKPMLAVPLERQFEQVLNAR